MLAETNAVAGHEDEAILEARDRMGPVFQVGEKLMPGSDRLGHTGADANDILEVEILGVAHHGVAGIEQQACSAYVLDDTSAGTEVDFSRSESFLFICGGELDLAQDPYPRSLCVSLQGPDLATDKNISETGLGAALPPGAWHGDPTHDQNATIDAKEWNDQLPLHPARKPSESACQNVIGDIPIGTEVTFKPGSIGGEDEGSPARLPGKGKWCGIGFT
jgi:hypothetical protein